jgi:hypothetical protein
MFKIIKKAISGGGNGSNNGGNGQPSQNDSPSSNHVNVHPGNVRSASPVSNSCDYLNSNQNNMIQQQKQQNSSQQTQHQNNFYYSNIMLVKKDIKGKIY